MREVWLKTNRRVLGAASILPSFGILASLAVGWFADGWIRWLALAMAFVCIGVTAMLLTAMRRPVLERDGQHLLVYLTSGKPQRIPLELVEVFFRGEGPVEPEKEDESPNAANIVVRLAERAHDWQHRDVKKQLGHWCEGYITIRGMWCEPIDQPLMEHLNQRLIAAHRERRAEAAAQ